VTNQPSRIRVLVVDDDPLMRDLICHMVGVLGFEVVGTAGDGEEAIECSRQLQPDVILMDIMMPRLNGIDATRAIMAERPTAIIFVSGFLQDEIRERAIAAGAASLVQKPFTLGDLQLALETCTRPAGLPG
jgi:CheY-like chemotaxis protein